MELWPLGPSVPARVTLDLTRRTIALASMRDRANSELLLVKELPRAIPLTAREVHIPLIFKRIRARGAGVQRGTPIAALLSLIASVRLTEERRRGWR